MSRPTDPNSAEYDFIIIGGGSAGCALANRLSADPSHRVLVLEAGRRDWKADVFIHMPAALTRSIGNRFYDWKYESEPEPFMGGRRVYHARGKVLGGSSSINGMIFQRGNPMDYDKWATEPGMGHWGYEHCLPYFKRMENRLVGGDEWRGDHGPLRLETGPARSPLFDAWLDAGVEAGFHRTADVNGYRQEGFAVFDKNIVRGRRLSVARAYLHPVLDRPNLTLRTLAQVGRIVFEGKRAVGVEYRRGGRCHLARAAEIICCGGAFNTPQLLQLSGVGDAVHLGSLGIDVVAAVPGVGENLQDHLEVYVQHACKEPVSMQPYLAKWRMPIIGLQWLFRRGPAATNHFEAGAFLRSNDEVEYPNLMFHFLPIAVRYDGSAPTAGHGYQVHVGPMYSDVRGTVKITSTDPRYTRPYSSTTCRRGTIARSGSRRSAPPGWFSTNRRSSVSTAARYHRVLRWKPIRKSSTGWPATPRRLFTLRARPAWALTQWPSLIRRRCESMGSKACASSTRRSCRTSRTAISMLRS